MVCVASRRFNWRMTRMRRSRWNDSRSSISSKWVNRSTWCRRNSSCCRSTVRSLSSKTWLWAFNDSFPSAWRPISRIVPFLNEWMNEWVIRLRYFGLLSIFATVGLHSRIITSLTHTPWVWSYPSSEQSDSMETNLNFQVHYPPFRQTIMQPLYLRSYLTLITLFSLYTSGMHWLCRSNIRSFADVFSCVSRYSTKALIWRAEL